MKDLTLLLIVVFFVSLFTMNYISSKATLNETKRHYAAIEQMRSYYNKESLANSERFNQIIEESL